MHAASGYCLALASALLALPFESMAQPADGVYSGRTRQGRAIAVTVAGGNVTRYVLTYACSTPSGTIISSGTTTVDTSCTIQNGNFSCGNSACIPAPGAVATQVEGRFDGTHLSGTFLLTVGGPGFCACGFNAMPYNADLAGTEGTTIHSANLTCSRFSRPSQFFVDAGSAAELADDMVVPTGQTYVVSRVWSHGSYGSTGTAGPTEGSNGTGGPIDGVDVKFFADAGGSPGAVQCGYTALSPVGRPNVADFVVDLPTPCRLAPGRWWLSVQGRMPRNPRGQWFWAEATDSAGSGYRFQDPANVLGTGCTTWGSGPACFEPDPVNQNACFLLKGSTEESPLFVDGFEDAAP